MALTPEQRAANRFDRMYEKSKEWSPARYLRKFVTKDFQRMTRAEAGMLGGFGWAVVECELKNVWADQGSCFCVTCGTVGPWSAGGTAGQNRGGMQTGHFIASRAASIVLEPTNVAPQCAGCNIFRHGEQEKFAIWMKHVYGQDKIDRLKALKNGPAKQWDREELIRLRIDYLDRTKAAIKAMGQ